ncbi:hypothetical protein O7632_02270 [Solwaraspora sp. WMMD406]|uniref:hypothetical protein n=1 Tax=Solwaraspora sp. WMMD406 TaxID=3016095 RepID=UPI002416E3E3|nr:hypothetical protein [Solwaraspora sp. WMMD406]MDG4762945.1 hypothetical protein [Solwaraspora sp. WMMD406]
MTNGQHPINQPSADYFTPVPPPRPTTLADADEQPRYVIHIPIHARDLTAAIEAAHTIAVTLADWRTYLRELDYPETTVTIEGDQTQHHRVICNLQQPDGTRCEQLNAHEAPCTR